MKKFLCKMRNGFLLQSTHSSLDSDVTSIDESFLENLQHSVDSSDSDKSDGLENAIVSSESKFVKDEIHANSSATSVPVDDSGSIQALLLPHEVLMAHGGQIGSVEKEMSEEVKLSSTSKNDLGSSNAVKDHGRFLDEPSSIFYPASRNTKGKNPYALSVLRQLELKLDGRDIENTSSMEIAKQVDYLLKQATSIDNLCNMYEGWTPWI